MNNLFAVWTTCLCVIRCFKLKFRKTGKICYAMRESLIPRILTEVHHSFDADFNGEPFLFRIPLPTGLEWKEVGNDKPMRGTLIKSIALAEELKEYFALSKKSKAKKVHKIDKIAKIGVTVWCSFFFLDCGDRVWQF